MRKLLVSIFISLVFVQTLFAQTITVPATETIAYTANGIEITLSAGIEGVQDSVTIISWDDVIKRINFKFERLITANNEIDDVDLQRIVALLTNVPNYSYKGTLVAPYIATNYAYPLTNDWATNYIWLAKKVEEIDGTGSSLDVVYDNMETNVTKWINAYYDIVARRVADDNAIATSGVDEPTWVENIGDFDGDGRVTWICQALTGTPATWQASTSYSIGDTVIPTEPNGFMYTVSGVYNPLQDMYDFLVSKRNEMTIKIDQLSSAESGIVQ